jgi:hypothetical protein
MSGAGQGKDAGMRIDQIGVTSTRLPPKRRAIRLRDTIGKLDSPEAAVFFFLVACSQGRPRFASTLADLVKKTNCSRERFTMLTAALAEKGLISIHGSIHGLGSELVIWGIPMYPQEWERPVLGEQKFRIPGPPSRGGRPRRKAP